jgi:hypothetical protein
MNRRMFGGPAFESPEARASVTKVWIARAFGVSRSASFSERIV